MGQTITIAPVTRVEGHGKVTILLDDRNEVTQARFHVTEFRGFEKFCEGRLASEMPVITTRVCGICPVSHHLAAAKAVDEAFGVEIPPAAKKLRELMHMGQVINSHALHFFLLSGPDLLLGPESDPAKRNVFGLIGANPELAKQAIRLRQIGQDLVERVGGRPIHPVTAIPGGMSRALSHEHRFLSQRDAGEAVRLAQLGVQVGKQALEQHADLVPRFGALQTPCLGMVDREGHLRLYDGRLRLVDQAGQRLEEVEPRRYLDIIGERVEDWSYLKFPYYRRASSGDGMYRVGPLARLNAADSISTPLANQELQEFRQHLGRMVHGTLHYHQARLIELLYATERAQELLSDDDVVSPDVRVVAPRREGEGVGVIEAPRGTLIHHYWVDELGKVVRANLIVATGHNNAAINASVTAVAKEFVKGGKVTEGALNHVEMAIRCYDPCLSCSTHALGRMPLVVEVVSPDGEVVDQVRRSR
jgi:NAD-reducing hydrogenase large subunit